MRWDPTGHRLVVSFEDSNLLAVFQTQVSPANISLLPLGFINSEGDDEFPSCFEFAPDFNEGALLTIVRFFFEFCVWFPDPHFVVSF